MANIGKIDYQNIFKLPGIDFMTLLKTIKNRLKSFKKLLSSKTTSSLEQQNAFLLAQIAQINEKLRYIDLQKYEACATQTKASFDYQWKEITEGDDLPSDQTFFDQTDKKICEMTQLSSEWFKGKDVLDAGCGMGRFTHGFLYLGAHVTACDQSSWAIKQTQELCSPFADKLQAIQANLLHDTLPGKYDLVFSFGVVHHTGNTYLAIRNVCNLVKPGGKICLMVYGFPESYEDFIELNTYETLRTKLRGLSFEEKHKQLSQMFPKEQVHGWFDAVSPEINDLLTCKY
jgi:2-polyprenyl-3-methyl-5-hydroxy-6-metoxy-1,4-benzoquinol methylase